jgi:serine phosphatase RsbU (regulator of sigma subunit)
MGRLSLFFRDDGVSHGAKWLPVLLVFGSILAVAYADYVAVTISLGYLYVLPLGISAMFLRRRISYGLIAVCVFLHDFFGPPYVDWRARLVHNLTAFFAFAFVVYFIQRYVSQREGLAREIRDQRDALLKDVQLAAQVQRMFLPVNQPSIAGLDIAGMMQPARGVGGDYYDFIPINAHTIQLVVADVAGKGVPAALLMSATAAAMQLESNQVRDILQIITRLNSGIHSVSDGVRYVTLLLAEIDAAARTLRYVNCGHNPGVLLRGRTGEIVLLESTCPPVGMFAQDICQLNRLSIESGDILVLYTDGVTEAENRVEEEFGMERLRRVIKENAALSASEIMQALLRASADFSRDVGFSDDVTIVLAKCAFAE